MSHLFARLGVEPLEDRRLLAVGTFTRVQGDVWASASAYAYVEDVDENTQYDFGAPSEVFAHAKAISTQSGESGFAFAETETYAHALPAVGEVLTAPFVSTSVVEKRFASGEYARGWGGDFGTGHLDVAYEADPENAEDLVLHVHLFVAGNGGVGAVSDGSSAWGDWNLLATFGQTQVRVDLVGGEWQYSSNVPGQEISGSTSSGIALHHTFVVPISNGGGAVIHAQAGGVSQAEAFEGGAEFLGTGVVAAWVYVTSEGTDDTPGDFNHDGNVNADDYGLWASADPRADGDLDGDIDNDDLDIWAANTNILLVTTDVDESDGDYTFGDLSLREAIALAADGNHPGQDAIMFAPWVDEIVLTSGQLTIAGGNDLEIVGPGADQLSLKGRVSSPARVFQINAGANVAIRDLTIGGGRVTGSNNGGGILNSGSLSLDSVIVSNNTSLKWGGGIYSSGPLSIENSTITANQAQYRGGGVVLTDSTLNVTNSSITNNTVASTTGPGGGINANNPSAVTINSSTFDGNSAGSGGGLDLTNAIGYVLNATIDNSTFSNNIVNYSGGGISLSPFGNATIDIRNSTISTNTAGGSSSSGGGGVLSCLRRNWNFPSRALA